MTREEMVEGLLQSLESPECWKVEKRIRRFDFHPPHSFKEYHLHHRKCDIYFEVHHTDMSKWWQRKDIQWRAWNPRVDSTLLRLTKEERDRVSAAALALIEIHNKDRKAAKLKGMQEQLRCAMDCLQEGCGENGKAE